MSSPSKDNEETMSSGAGASNGGGKDAGAAGPRAPAKRRLSATGVIEILDTESDDSDVCAVNSYQATADEVKRIRGDYSSTSSSSDYSSDSESPWEDDSVLLEDKVPVIVEKAQLNPRANRMDEPKFNPALQSEDLIDRLSTHWIGFKDYKSDEVTLTSEPFRLCLLHDLLENSDIINNIVDDMNTLDWTRKKMDLYEFHQTTDLANLSWQRSIRCIYHLLKTEVMQWVSKVTGLELQNVSASCSLYGPGDHLLLHDDCDGDRRVAFILYLAPWTPRPRPRASAHLHNGDAQDKHADEPEACRGWSAAMGGALELFTSDAQGRPTDATHRIFPRNNTLAFFPVDHHSFHQVSEVLSMELPRLSINGWFHGPAAAAPPAAPPPAAPPLLDDKPHTNVVVLSEWLSSAYMCPRARASVAAQMERCSEVCLHAVLQPAVAAALLEDLASPEVEWERLGAGQQRRYERVGRAWAAAHARDNRGAALLQLASSLAFVRALTDCTDLALSAIRRLELQRWRAGDFSLIPPREHYQAPRLELVLYLGVGQRAFCGGHTVFLAPEEAHAPPSAAPSAAAPAAASEPEDAALVTLPPRHNALSLVYCDSGAASFTKYVSRLTMPAGECFYILSAAYAE